MFKNILTALLCTLLVIQTGIATADLHVSTSSGFDYMDIGHSHDGGDKSSALSFEETEFNCHDCGHCHGHSHSAIPLNLFSVSVIVEKDLNDTFSQKYSSRITSPYIRPPIV